jgi:hypothetical protein
LPLGTVGMPSWSAWPRPSAPALVWVLPKHFQTMVSLVGAGRPVIRGMVCGLMTTLGGVGHTLPFLMTNFNSAMMLAIAVVALELAAISWIRHKYMDTPLLAAAFQVVVGGILVFLTGILIGSA